MDSESVSSNQTDQSTMSVITSVRYDRSRIAAEAQQLANRIRLLKSEEAKALKRVENTKKRAKELVIAREEMAQSLEERRLAVEHHNRQEALKQEQLQVDRERIKAQILQNRERRVRAKQRDAVRVKQQRAQDLEDLRKRNLEEAERVKIQSLLVREERDERRQKLHKLKIAQEERSREIYSAKVRLNFDTQSATSCVDCLLWAAVPADPTSPFRNSFHVRLCAASFFLARMGKTTQAGGAKKVGTIRERGSKLVGAVEEHTGSAAGSDADAGHEWAAIINLPAFCDNKSAAMG